MNEIHPLVAYPPPYLLAGAVLALAAVAFWWYTRPLTTRRQPPAERSSIGDYRSETQRFMDEVADLREAWAHGTVDLRELHLAAARAARRYGSAIQGENYLAATRSKLEHLPQASDVAAVVALCEAPSFSDREQQRASELFAALDALGERGRDQP